MVGWMRANEYACPHGHFFKPLLASPDPLTHRQVLYSLCAVVHPFDDLVTEAQNVMAEGARGINLSTASTGEVSNDAQWCAASPLDPTSAALV